MPKYTIRSIILALASVGVTGAVAAVPTLYEEQIARAEERMIIQQPIAGLQNRFWFNYRTNVGEAQKELASDLRRVSDTEDLRDAWEEYRTELSGERRHYIKEMQERGHVYGTVTVEE